MRKLSLFSGIGGIDLAAHWAGMETVAFCEREPFPRRVLAHHWPGIPIYEDVCTLTREVLERDGIIGPDRAIDIVSAGYPCQPESLAGQRRGTEDDRWLWPYVIRLIREIRPRFFIGENVAGHISMGLDTVLADLAAANYEVQVFVIPAAAVYGSHRRDRVFIVGHTECFGFDWESRRGTEQEPENGCIQRESSVLGDTAGSGLSQRGRSERTEIQQETGTGLEPEFERSSQNVADSKGQSTRGLSIRKRTPDTRFAIGSQDVANGNCAGQQECRVAAITNRSGLSTRGANPGGLFGATQPGMGGNTDEFSAWLDRGGVNPLDKLADLISSYPQPALMGMPQYEWEPPRVATGIKERTARLKALGNAVDPLQIYPVMAAIKAVNDYTSC
ncbi:DNA cytosine methyltransferase [Paenibacillus sp. S150]|uniref:DNA cytosine methyltransferase n=1 Tax=Paenibacillus sp. S150 TaxID=2749826 RepID=UPI001C58174D|nr:DNA cytosine methyltransferase [Paenibacillus sp. S150]MBW4083597.1 DNA cytosine methyltransferase [Paenibacillus sp. S150]